MSETQRSLFVLTIGPVSTFVEGSRKMRDLYAGSFFLSYLANMLLEKIHLEGLAEQYQMDVIFPHYEEGQSANFMPNRIVAITDLDHAAQKKMGAELENLVHTEYDKICKKIYSCVGVDITGNSAITNQLRSVPHVYWTFTPLENYEEDYPALVEKINQVKSVRPFTQLLERSQKKCSLYPQYNVLVINSEEIPRFVSETNLVNLTKGEVENRKCKYAVKKKEHLSAFAFLKRAIVYANLDGYDSSISSVAYMLAKYKVAENLPNALEKLKELEDKGGVETIFDLQNGQLLTTEEYAQESIEIAHELYTQLTNNNVELKCYYCLLKFDGDGFGSLYKQHPNRENHKVFSGNIIAFAHKVKEIIERNRGVSIFAGGEDFLGFLPVNHLFSALKELRSEFQNIVELPGCGKKLTFSAGITMAHLMEPLANIAKFTTDMEHHAKQIDQNKDAFAIKLIKRSGEELSIRCKFGEGGYHLDLFHRIGEVMTDANTSKRLFHLLMEALEPIVSSEASSKDEMVQTLIRYSVQKAEIEPSDVIGKYLSELYSSLGNNSKEFVKALNFLAFWIRECK